MGEIRIREGKRTMTCGEHCHAGLLALVWCRRSSVDARVMSARRL
jgi:hypothetical protein